MCNLWIVYGKLPGIGWVKVPAMTKYDSLAELEQAINGSETYSRLEISKIEAVGEVKGPPGMGCWTEMPGCERGE